MFLYRWKIERVEGYQQSNGLQEVLGIVGWELEVRDTEDNSVHYLRSVTNLPEPDSEDFVDYLELSEEVILEWVWSVVGRSDMEDLVSQQLEDMRNPPEDKLTTFGMPWLGSCCPDGEGMPEGMPGVPGGNLG